MDFIYLCFSVLCCALTVPNVGSAYRTNENVIDENVIDDVANPRQAAEHVTELDILTKEGCVPCRCGMPNRRWTRSVGGKETVKHEFPWMAELQEFGDFGCGGSLINDRYVLTAAHCVRYERVLSELPEYGRVFDLASLWRRGEGVKRKMVLNG